ncbi:MAG: hypothetical protein JWL57_3260 [Actinobacteria bacterium]|nr:hypothetical protein [Actinomycetota bacterium]
MVKQNLDFFCAAGATRRLGTCYYMSMLDRRLQILIDEERWSRLEDEASRRQVSVSTLVREAIDERYPGRDQERRAALRALLDAEPMPVPDTDELRRELDDIRSRRLA